MAANLVRFGPIVLLAVLAINACSSGDSNSPANPPDQTLMGRTFVSTGVEGSPIPGGGPLRLTFKDNRVSADAGCNTHSGAVALAEQKLVVSSLASTLMACGGDRQGADEWLSGLLNSQPAWQLDGPKLTLKSDNLTVTMLDKKVAEPDKPLRGTTWIVTALLTPEAQIRSQAIDDVKPTLTIATDGKVSGTAGCNTMNGSATGTDPELTFRIATTRMACAPEVMEVEQAVLKALDGKATATVDANALTIKNENGNGLVLHAQ
ncbi:META domain-containing protein [Nocardia brasiliensis]|uniref:META domain-containing protein n=1 Tax=Nocardia brasiliensis TaxID=37326 RepID=UPI0037B2447D